MKRRNILTGFIVVPLCLLFRVSIYKPTKSISIGSRVMSRSKVSRIQESDNDVVFYTQGTVIHIATNTDHPYGESKYLVEYIVDGQAFHGYSKARDLIKK